MKPRRVLFLCTGNCVRSPMAEAILRYRGGKRFQVFSAGTEPAGFIHPMALQVLREIRVNDKNLESKSWEIYKDQVFDGVITLCAGAYERTCALWSSSDTTIPVKSLWSFEDPSQAQMWGVEARLEAFRDTRNLLRECIERLALAPDALLQDDRAFADLIRNVESYLGSF